MIRLYSQDLSEKLFETEYLHTAEDYLRNSGYEWLVLIRDFGANDWRNRWSGRMVLKQDGTIETVHGSELLKYMMAQPNSSYGEIMSSENRPHESSADCWCNPTVEHVPPQQRLSVNINTICADALQAYASRKGVSMTETVRRFVQVADIIIEAHRNGADILVRHDDNTDRLIFDFDL